jgi:hypothetical protein
MGFPDYLIEEALKETSGLEPAVNWITSKLDNDDLDVVDVVDPDSLQQLLAMGFDEEMAKQALIHHVRYCIYCLLTVFRKERWKRRQIGFLTTCSYLFTNQKCKDQIWFIRILQAINVVDFLLSLGYVCLH